VTQNSCFAKYKEVTEKRFIRLSQANVTVRLKDGRTIRDRADGARGYPGRLTDDELHTKFLACAGRSLPHDAALRVLDALRTVESMPAIAALTQLCSIDRNADVSVIEN
jgi:hypothetical protein